MYRKVLVLVAAIICFQLIVGTSHAAPYYKGKTIHIVVGFSAGGGFDLFSRAIARHMGKHIEGNPAIIVDNMAGAGGFIAANHVYKVAKPDGLTIGHFGSLLLPYLLRQEGVQFDYPKFEFIGAPESVINVLVWSKASGINSMDKLFTLKRQAKLGAATPGNFAIYNFPVFVNKVLEYPVQIVSGYKGTADMKIAMESGELDGYSCGLETVKDRWQKGDLYIGLYSATRILPEFKKANILQMRELAKTDEARRLIEAGIDSNLMLTRAHVLPPGTPKDLLQILRNAFKETFVDKDFLKEAEKANLNIDPVTGEEIEQFFKTFPKLDAPTLAKLKKICYE